MFQSDETDVELPLDSLWFQFDHPIKIDDYRLGLLAYIATSDLIGNIFQIQGSTLPSHLASVLHTTFEGHELFISEVTNNATQIYLEPVFDELVVDDAGLHVTPNKKRRDAGRLVFCKKSELGNNFENNHGEQLLAINTNLQLFTSLCCRFPNDYAAVILYLLVFDTLRPAALRYDIQDSTLRSKCRQWLKEIGGNLV
jgi:hypothetical protein